MLYRALLLTMIVIVAVGALLGAIVRPGDLTGAFAGCVAGVTIDLGLGFAVASVLAVMRAASGAEPKAHRHAG